jgi:predicted ATPase
MLTSIRLKNFKCFLDEEIPLCPLTVLSGVNGMGKSTVLQSLLILRQSIISRTINDKGALLNGPLISLGTADDILYEHAESDDLIEISIKSDDGAKGIFAFNYEKGSPTLPNAISEKQEDKITVLSGEQFYYLNAERSGPRTSFPFADHEMAKYNPIGNSGEFSSFILSRNERKNIGSKQLQHKNEKLPELRKQIETWMSELGQSIQIHLREFSKMDIVGMEFSFIRDGLPSMNYRPTNVGFGLTYSLPIFVSCLLAEQNSLILIENPEAHLHPKGQVAIGKFLAQAAAAGIQVIIETHSDHILNGIRITTKQKDIAPESVALHFFDRARQGSHAIRISPQIDADGRLDQWPDGFFDEWEKGLAELL